MDLPERKALEDWADSESENRKFFEESLETWSLIDQINEPAFEPDVDAAMARFNTKLDDFERKSLNQGGGSEASKGRIRYLQPRHLIRIAAVLLPLIVVSIWMLKRTSPQDAFAYCTDTRTDDPIILADGSAVVLAPNSCINYREVNQERRLELTGGGYFDIERDEASPFIIEANGSEVRVLGTAFYLEARPEDTIVQLTVTEGLVAFSSTSSGLSKQIAAGEGATLNLKSQEMAQKVDTIPAEVWKDDQLNFYEKSLAQVAPILERFYDISIQLDGFEVGKLPVTGQFERNPLNRALTDLQFILNSEGLKVEAIDQSTYRFFIE